MDELISYLTETEYPELEDFPADMPDHLRQRLVACGYFSSVWTMPQEPSKVLKVSHRESDACRHYMRWVFDQPHDHAPKIHSINYHDDLMLVVMDRYFKPEDWDDWGHPTLVPGNLVLRGSKKPSPYDTLELFCAEIHENLKGMRFDLHRDNIMADQYGNLIVTDPVSFVNTEAHEEGL